MCFFLRKREQRNALRASTNDSAPQIKSLLSSPPPLHCFPLAPFPIAHGEGTKNMINVKRNVKPIKTAPGIRRRTKAAPSTGRLWLRRRHRHPSPRQPLGAPPPSPLLFSPAEQRAGTPPPLPPLHPSSSSLKRMCPSRLQLQPPLAALLAEAAATATLPPPSLPPPAVPLRRRRRRRRRRPLRPPPAPSEAALLFPPRVEEAPLSWVCPRGRGSASLEVTGTTPLRPTETLPPEEPRATPTTLPCSSSSSSSSSRLFLRLRRPSSLPRSPRRRRKTSSSARFRRRRPRGSAPRRGSERASRTWTGRSSRSPLLRRRRGRRLRGRNRGAPHSPTPLLRPRGAAPRDSLLHLEAGVTSPRPGPALLPLRCRPRSSSGTRITRCSRRRRQLPSWEETCGCLYSRPLGRGRPTQRRACNSRAAISPRRG